MKDKQTTYVIVDMDKHARKRYFQSDLLKYGTPEIKLMQWTLKKAENDIKHFH